MKGLILKDIYNLATLFRIYTILPILAIVISYSQHSLGMLQFLPAFIGMFATISAFAYDEQSNFDSFAMTLPINRKDMVISKYVLALVCIFASMLLSMVSQEHFQTVELSGFLAECCGVAIAMLFLNAIMLPMIIKYGSMKARVLIIICFMLLGFLGSFVISHIGGILPQNFFIFLHDFKDWLLPVSFLGALFILLISALSSMHLMKQKEF